MKNIVLALLVSLTACGIDTSQRITPAVADGSDLTVWTGRVQSAIKHWQQAIGDDCQFPITVGTLGAPITLVPVAAMPKRGLTTTGYDQLDVKKIDIRTGMDPLETHGVIMHELGHAIGLGHETGDDSIMSSPSSVISPSAADVARARAALGC